jgi:hypothetical protein
MLHEAGVYEHCDWCGREILFGNAVVTLNKNIEQVDATEESPEGVITVIESDTLLTLCADCGNRLDGSVLRAMLKPA